MSQPLSKQRRTSAGAWLACVCLLVASNCAQPAGAQELDFRWHHFGDNGGTVVNTAVFDLNQPWRNGDDAFTFAYSVDQVTMPAIKGVPGSEDHLDAITAASRPISGVHKESESYRKRRHQLEGGMVHGELSGGLYVSLEEDWRAHQASLGWNRALAADNTIVGIQGSYGWDRITPLADDNSPSITDQRQAVAALASVAQTINVRTNSRITLEIGHVSGFQGNPYRSVRTDSSIVAEVHPRSRLRTAVSAELLRYLDTRSSVRLGYRFYQDDWDVQSHTGDAEFKQRIADAFVVRYRYRNYTQTGAYFHRERYTDPRGVDGFLTADYKLRPLRSNLFGVKLSIPALALLHAERWLQAADLHIRYERYYNSTDFAAGIIETGIAVAF